MPTLSTVPRAEAITRKVKREDGPRVKARKEFLAYAQQLADNPAEALIFRGFEPGEDRQFIVKLQHAFKRLDMTDAHVRKTRNADEVRAWIGGEEEEDSAETNDSGTNEDDTYEVDEATYSNEDEDDSGETFTDGEEDPDSNDDIEEDEEYEVEAAQ